ncbi:hypothetical protein PR048_013145 [Dryococelus australis]|uniref:Uncharacterized protein n=1 Tax=Dryococelus australis TaxID=614101 RepID=A0ABQ9HRI1_9NEOP|nr:hypothetical protein PR048_013145 [Dryococelus australis]
MHCACFLSLHACSLMKYLESNPAEHYNGAVAKLMFDKHINFLVTRSYQARCLGAVVQHNTGLVHYKLHKTVYNTSPGIYCKNVKTQKQSWKEKLKCLKSLFTSALTPDLEWMKKSTIFSKSSTNTEITS